VNETTARATERIHQWAFAHPDNDDNNNPRRDGYIYYIGMAEGSIRRLKEDGSVTELVLAPGLHIVSNVAIDTQDQTIYYLTRSPSPYQPTGKTYGLEYPHALWQYSMRTKTAPVLLADGLRTCRGLTLDSRNGVVYFFNYVHSTETIFFLFAHHLP
jgi:hypothetical protein